MMTIPQRLAAAAMLGGLAVGTATTAWAAPTMSGPYLLTISNPDSDKTAWEEMNFTPCGNGCADESRGNRATLVNGQWTMDTIEPLTCPGDLTNGPNALRVHYTWDPNTLAGTIRSTYAIAACGKPAGFTQTVNMQLH